MTTQSKKDIEWHLSKMEKMFAKDIKQPHLIEQDEALTNWLGADSGPTLRESDFFELTDDIRWLANEIGPFDSEEITDYYRKSEYGKTTRWDLFNESVLALKANGIKTVVDLGAANNHFAFLGRKAGLDAYGVEPRKQVLLSSQDTFAKSFGAEKRFGFVGSLKTFADYVLLPECDLRVDCVSVLNFLHGNGHDPQEIVNLFKAFEKCASYILIMEPLWNDLGLSRLMDDKYEEVIEVHKPNSNVGSHSLYRFCP